MAQIKRQIYNTLEGDSGLISKLADGVNSILPAVRSGVIYEPTSETATPFIVVKIEEQGAIDPPLIGRMGVSIWIYDEPGKSYWAVDRIIKEKLLKVSGVLGFFPANSVGDDIEVYTDDNRNKVLTRFINLRNQNLKENNIPNLCLSDFVAPKDSGMKDYIGTFAFTAGLGIEKALKQFEAELDDYNSIMLKALADRLAEAFTELVHEKVRKDLWGYKPDENLSFNDLLLEKYQGIRPAHGYPACLDHSEKDTLFKLMDVTKNAGISLTENYSMYPGASVSGLLFAHPQSKYFMVGKISKDQVADYAKRKNVSDDIVEKWLASNLNYK